MNGLIDVGKVKIDNLAVEVILAIAVLAIFVSFGRKIENSSKVTLNRDGLNCEGGK